jgi:hypothetical protein
VWSARPGRWLPSMVCATSKRRPLLAPFACELLTPFTTRFTSRAPLERRAPPTHFMCSGTAFSVSTGAMITLLNVFSSCETPLAVRRTPADPRGVYSAFGGDDYLFYNFVSRCAPPPASALAHRLLT